jgi:radical SAM protein with 4Fe4S-binding SPASM domain
VIRLGAGIRRAAWRGYLSAAARLHQLKTISWEATYRCQLRCRHCANDSSPRADSADELTTDEILHVVETIAADFEPAQLAFSIGGGEPLLREDLFTVTARLNELGFAWGLVSNGLLLDKRRLRQCCETGIGALSISLDGLQHHHERLRGPNTFQPAVAAIRRARDSGTVPVLEASTILAAGVARELTEIKAQMLALGVNRWRILPLAPAGRAREQLELQPTVAELRRVLDWLQAERAAADPPLDITFDESGYLGEPYERTVRGAPFMCGAGISGAQICADGAVSGCPFIGRAFVQGNVRQRRFSEIWQREFRPLRDRRWARRGLCADCASFGDCRGGCLLNWESLSADGPRCCLCQRLNGGEGRRE